MRLKIIICFVLLSTYSCNNQNSTKGDRRFIELLASEYPLQIMEDGNILPSRFIDISFFVKCNNTQVAEANINALIRLYDKSYKSISFYTFLKQILDQKLSIKSSNEFICFTLDDKVTLEYKKLGFEKFIELYFLKATYIEAYKLKSGIEDKKLKTIYYYCYLNNYLYSQSDYGVTYIRKMEYYLLK